MPPVPKKQSTPAEATKQPDSVDLTGLGLMTRVARIQGELVDVPKNGHANVQTQTATYSYDYVTEPDMMTALKPLLAKYEVACLMDFGTVDKDGNMRTVRGSLTLAIDDPSVEDTAARSWTIHAHAAGTDKGDKAISKAMTTLTRYLLQKTFLIATDGVDPEKDTVEHQPGERSTSQPRRPNGRQSERTSAPKTHVTQAQRSKLWATAQELGIAADKLREIIMVTCGVLSTGEIPRASFNQLLADLQGYAANPAGGDKFIAQWRTDNPDLSAQLTAKMAAEADVPADPPAAQGDTTDTPFGPADDPTDDDGGEGYGA